MQDIAIERRVDRLEEALMEMAYQSRKTEIELERLSREMRDFKKEMKDFKDEMKDFKDEMKDFKDEMKDFKDEMKDFKDEMREFKREINKKWGDLANRLGTLAEDIVAPGVPRAIERTFNLKVTEVSVRRKRKKNDKLREYDVIAVAGDYLFLIDVKSTYRYQYIENFEEAINEFLDFFPEYKGLKIIPVIASLNLPEDTINIATKKKWLALQLYGDYLEFVNKDVVAL